MISPILFIGVGGSGRSTLHWLYDDIRRELIQRGWPWIERELSGHPMPRCWGFVAIDSDYKPNSRDPEVPEGEIDRVEIVQPPVALTSIHKGVVDGPYGFSRLGWLPGAHRLPVIDPQYGLAQYRALGRMTAMHQMSEVVTSIRRAAAGISSGEAQSDLALVGECLGAPVSTAGSDRRVVVVSSLSGGTGSGAWLDVAQYLASRPINSADAWLRQSQTAILYLPELFENLDGPRDGIAPNSMFALSELLSAYADRSPEDIIDADLQRLFAGAPSASEANAPRSVFFIGRRSGGMDFATPTEAYASTSRMLGALLLDSSNSSAFERVTVNMSNTNRVPLLEASAVPASNVGFGRIDLGFQAFGEFVSRSLFRSSALNLLDPPRVANAADDRQRIAETCDRVQRAFFADCGLHEQDDTERNDQILTAIGGRDPENIKGAFRTKMQSSIERLANIKKVTPRQIGKEIEDGAASAIDAGRRGMFERTVAYSDTVREDLISAVTTYSARYSVPVTIELLARLDEQLAAAAGQLRAQIQESEQSAAHFLGAFLDTLGLDRATEHFAELRRKQVFEFGVAFIKYTREGLVQPMRADLSRWHTGQTETVRASEFLSSTIRSWNGLDVPNDIRMPPTVVLVHELDKLPERTADLLRTSFRLPEDAARQAAIEEVVGGTWDGGTPAASDSGSGWDRVGFVQETNRFSLASLCPRRVKDADSDRQQIKSAASTFVTEGAAFPIGSFKFTSLTDLSIVASRWAQTRSGVREHVVTGFGEWLSPDHPEHQRRRRRFQTKLDQAIGRAAPTVVYDADAYQRVHGSGAPNQALMVAPPFPFSAQSDLGVLVEDRCDRAGLSGAQLPFDPAQQVDPGRIDLIRWYPDGLHPLTQSSVTQGIVTAFANPNPAFWRLRQSRPLSQTLALTPAQMVAMARGWLAIVGLNLIDRTRGAVYFASSSSSPIPADARALSATDAPPADASDWLSIALRSLPVRVVKYTTDPSSLDWYVTLAAFGGYAPDSSAEQEDAVARYGIGAPEVAGDAIDVEAVRAWIEHGATPGKDQPDPAVAGSSTGEATDRSAALLQWLSDWLEGLDEWIAEASVDADAYVTHPLSPETEMFPYFRTAAAQLIALIERIDSKTSAGRRRRGVRAG